MTLTDIQRSIGLRLARLFGPTPGPASAADLTPVVTLGAGERGVLDIDILSTTAKLWSVSQNRAEQHAFRLRMDREDGLISKALDITADTATAPAEGEGSAFEIVCEDQRTAGEVELLCDVLHLREESWAIARRLLKFGNEMREVTLDPSGTRVARYKLLPENQMWIRRDPYGNPLDPPWEQRPYYQQDGSGIPMADWQVTHYKHRPDDEGIYGRGVLDCERDWQRLQAEEDGMVQIRLARAGDRIVHYIPIDPARGATEIKAQIKEYTDAIRQRRQLSNTAGTSRRDSPSVATDDFFIPVPAGVQIAKVGLEPYSPVNAQLQNIGDVRYMRAKVIGKIGVPMRYLNMGGEEAARASLGDGGISYEDKQFARTVRTLQGDIRAGHLKVISIHLILRGLDPLANPVGLSFPTVSTTDDAAEAKTELTRAQAAQIIATLIGIPREVLLDRYVVASAEERDRWLKASADAMGANAAAMPAGERRQSLREMADALMVVACETLGIEAPPESGVEVDEHEWFGDAAGGNGRLAGAHPYPAPLARG